MANLSTPTLLDNTEIAKADILDGIEDVVCRIDELVDELGREIDLVTDDLSEDVNDDADDLGSTACTAALEIRRAFVALRAALADEVADDDDDD